MFEKLLVLVLWEDKSMSFPSPRFTGIFIPAEIFEIEGLTALDWITLSWIDALFCKEVGGCFASNKYLAQKLKVQENTIAKTLTKFRQMGLIEDVSFDGRKRIIRSCVNKFIEKTQSKAGLDLNPIAIGFKSNADLEQNPKPTYIESKEEIKDIEREGLSPHSLSSSFSNENLQKQKNPNITDIIKTLSAKKIKFGEYVEYSQEEYDQLVKDFSKVEVEQAITQIDDWWPDRDKKKYNWQGFYRGTRRWIRRIRENAKKEKTHSFVKTFQIPEDQIKIINERRDKSQEFFAKFRMNLDQRGIRFQILEKALQINNDIIDFRDNKFNDLVRNSLNKFGWIIPQKNHEKQLAMT